MLEIDIKCDFSDAAKTILRFVRQTSIAVRQCDTMSKLTYPNMAILKMEICNVKLINELIFNFKNSKDVHL